MDYRVETKQKTSNGLAIALVLPSATARALWQPLLINLPFLFLHRYTRSAVLASAAAENCAAMSWSGPRGLGWPDHRGALDAVVPSRNDDNTTGSASASTNTGVSAALTREPQATHAGANETTMPVISSLGLMLSAPPRQERHTTGGSASSLRQRAIQRRAPALFGLLGPRALAFTSTRAVPEKRVHSTSSSAVTTTRTTLEPGVMDELPEVGQYEPVSSASSTQQESERLSSRPGTVSAGTKHTPARAWFGRSTGSMPGLLPSPGWSGLNAGLGMMPPAPGSQTGSPAPPHLNEALPQLSTSFGSDVESTRSQAVPTASVQHQPPVRVDQVNVPSLRGFAAMAQTLEGLVQREVKTVVEQMIDPASVPAQRGTSSQEFQKIADLASDEAVRALMRKMREMEHEERFRAGKLR